jgi:hypothetical protein
VKGPGSASRVVVEPGLQVGRLGEIEQVFRQLLQLLQGQGGEPLSAALIEAPEAAAELANSQGSLSSGAEKRYWRSNSRGTSPRETSRPGDGSASQRIRSGGGA